jgi:hypothetical protein
MKHYICYWLAYVCLRMGHKFADMARLDEVKAGGTSSE